MVLLLYPTTSIFPIVTTSSLLIKELGSHPTVKLYCSLPDFDEWAAGLSELALLSLSQFLGTYIVSSGPFLYIILPPLRFDYFTLHYTQQWIITISISYMRTYSISCTKSRTVSEPKG